MDQQITCKNCGAQLDIEARNGDNQTLCPTCQQLQGTFYPADLVSLIDDEPSIVILPVAIDLQEKGKKFGLVLAIQ